MKQLFTIVIILFACVQMTGCKYFAKGEELDKILDAEIRVEQIKAQERTAADKAFKNTVKEILHVFGFFIAMSFVVQFISKATQAIKARRDQRYEALAQYERDRQRVEAEEATARHRATEDRKMHVAVQEVEKTRIIEMSKVLIAEQMANARILLEGGYLLEHERQFLLSHIVPNKNQLNEDDFTDFTEASA
jgi:hypothetical protein